MKPGNIRIRAARTDRFPEGGGDALSGLATILDRNPHYYLLEHDRFAEAWVEGVLPMT